MFYTAFLVTILYCFIIYLNVEFIIKYSLLYDN